MPNKELHYFTIPEFDKDFKRLQKRFRTLPKDFEIMKKYSLETHYLKGVPTTAFVPIEGYCSEDYESLKVRKFACMALKNLGNRTGIRVIFVFEPETMKITFIEIYFKGDKENEDRYRLKQFLESL